MKTPLKNIYRVSISAKDFFDPMRLFEGSSETEVFPKVVSWIKSLADDMGIARPTITYCDMAGREIDRVDGEGEEYKVSIRQAEVIGCAVYGEDREKETEFDKMLTENIENIRAEIIGGPPYQQDTVIFNRGLLIAISILESQRLKLKNMKTVTTQ